MFSTIVAEATWKREASTVEGALVELDGERYYRVSNYDAMPPFFMSLVSDSDHWFFISSNGALTAGRRDPDHALFPYYTDDRIHDSLDQTGGKTILRVHQEGGTSLWEPFSDRYQGLYRISRNLYKSMYGNKILFEEYNHDLGLCFRTQWMNSERFGFVRASTLLNLGVAALAVELLDGIQNVLPYGLVRRFQTEFSTLGDGYKRTELLSGPGLALFRMGSIPVDRTEPSEALRVNAAWSTGLDGATHLLSSAQLGAFRLGRPLQEETEVRGQRGAYFLRTDLTLAPGSPRTLYVVAELNLDSAGVRALKQALESGRDLVPDLLADVAAGTQNLVRIVASADGLQATRDELSTWRHFANTLFNVMRGGVPDDGYRVSRKDLEIFLAKANTEVASRHAAWLEGLPEFLAHRDLAAMAEATGDLDLERLAREYLPLAFSRRHGDPSRPWNTFSIQVKDDQGRKILGYEGNWRDIFQNWEALAFSFPEFLDGMIFKFADASTADGHNPYHVLREGFDWEVIDPKDPWSFIGYWGDHQVIYLLKLLEASFQHDPGRLLAMLARRVFTYADVPYRIKPFEALLADPRRTIDFDPDAHREVMDRVRVLGADGKLLRGTQGILRANLAEKLLVVALTKLTNYVPGAGIWMNTQRPEWNDANNALVGYGVSMVTLCYLRRYLAFCSELFAQAGAEPVQLSTAIEALLASVAGTLERHRGMLAAPLTAQGRGTVLKELGLAGSAYRAAIYDGAQTAATVPVDPQRLQSFFAAALAHIDTAIQANRRTDGLYHAYNLMKVTEGGIEVRTLYEMLEGQVAALSSGALGAEEALHLLDSLRASRLYRPDQASYILYPDRTLPKFLELNNLPVDAVPGSELLQALLAAGDDRLVTRDVEGRVHFNAAFRNAGLLGEALAALGNGPFQDLAERETPQLLALYERVFDHQSFTGRSGTFYKYEGLGCIYWHMVSKLLLAVGEVLQRALAAGAAPATVKGLRDHYRAIREGIGVHKSPEVYGAIPTDPYSHTPSSAGAQQPGMTGQVKEDFLTRFAELGLRVEGGRITFRPDLADPGEFCQSARTFDYYDLGGSPVTLALEADCLAFTLCQVPVIVHQGGVPGILLTLDDGSTLAQPGLALDPPLSAEIFGRRGRVTRVEVHLGA